ncbi:ThuA domain-containing protein [Agromyces sp. NPDC056965]|uniref:ThuA domain-containing protein n=1 Tax=Agromyces sp. NPDC056965 TaxID=3345983 RepID=UPI00363943AD
MRAVILSGSGRYADPWHPYAETSAALAEVLEGAGITTIVTRDIDAALAGLDDSVRLIVVNAGDPSGPVPSDVPDSRVPVPGGPQPGDVADAQVVAAANAAFDAAVDRGIGILAMHAASSSLRDYPAFDRLIGARWERGLSWHPPIGDARVHIVGEHGIAADLADFSVFDERYTDFRRFDVVEPIAEHEHDGRRHSLVWARESGRSRLVYDALGHDVRSFASPGHRELLVRALDWLAGAPVPATGAR